MKGKSVNELRNISVYRTQLMGIAILWVMLFHSQIDMDCNVVNKILSLGYGGVDIFLFLSGYGLYYASLKNESTISFLRKRFQRVLPAFWISVLFFDLLFGHFSISSYIWKMTTVGFWLPALHIPYSLWYISTIIVFYLLFLCFINSFRSSRRPFKIVIVYCLGGLFLTGMYSCYFLCLHPNDKGDLVLAFARIPIFFIGVYFGWLSCKQAISNHLVNLCIVFFIIGGVILYLLTKHFDYWLLRNGALFYYPFIFIVPGMCLVLSRFFVYIPKKINRFFLFLGSLSLELYLVHEAVYAKMISFKESSLTCAWVLWPFVFFLCLLLAYFLSHITALVLIYSKKGGAYFLGRK